MGLALLPASARLPRLSEGGFPKPENDLVKTLDQLSNVPTNLSPEGLLLLQENILDKLSTQTTNNEVTPKKFYTSLQNQYEGIAQRQVKKAISPKKAFVSPHKIGTLEIEASYLDPSFLLLIY
ncbi:MAG: hypothetical protein MPJ24_09270 [Pirellulaceae bacterium]|nr:hypothetical protein [Pirellulaceae bacterium]